MIAGPAVVADWGSATWFAVRDGLLPPTAATDDQLHEAARFVISPDGHADDSRLQA
jgi:hypothetical protein